MEKAAPTRPDTTGPPALARISFEPALANGAEKLPVHAESDGREDTMFTSPPRVLRPKSALCGPRTNSTCSTSSRSRLAVLALSCGTPSK